MAKGLVDSVPVDEQWRKQGRGDGAAVHRLSAGYARRRRMASPRETRRLRGVHG